MYNKKKINLIEAINQALKAFNLKICSENIIDFQKSPICPIEAFYRSKGKEFILNVPISKCFSIEFSGSNPNNPFVKSLQCYENKTCSSYLSSPLKDFYSHWQPTNAVHYDNLERELAPPWDFGIKSHVNLSEGRHNRKDFIRVSRELKLTEAEIQGHISRGPVSDAFGEITFNRLVKIYNSIKINGYTPDKVKAGHMRGLLFTKDNDYRVTISSGKHRISALIALGYSHVPIQFRPIIIRREDVDSWPNVQAGYYTRELALTLFDRRFSDEHPSKWFWQPDDMLTTSNM